MLHSATKLSGLKQPFIIANGNNPNAHQQRNKYRPRGIYTMAYYSAIKKNEIWPFAAPCMDLEIIILSEVGQTEKDKYYMISLICGI